MDYKILVVDDEAIVRNVIERVLAKEDYIVEVVDSGRKALTQIPKFKPDLILLDLHLDDMSGLEILAELKKRYSDIITIMITAFPNVEDAVKAMKNGAYDFVQKPLMIEELVLTIRKALETLDLKKEVELLRKKQMEQKELNIVGNSREMQAILNDVEKFARTEVTVLIEGESGTGKELIAEYIHLLSRRYSKPFVAINCGAIPEELLESELFGYTKGAFTGASKEGKKGLIEEARSGTLFLDEINSMPHSAQVKLLRVLENKEYYPVGDATVRKADIRIVAACNESLEAMVEKKLFREDLYFRLNVARIHILPLRERQSDILPLAKYFLDQANQQFQRQITGFSAEAEEILLSLPFKGNARELRNFIDRVVILTTNSRITEEDLTLAGIEQGDKSFHIRVDLNSENKTGNVLQIAIKTIINKTLEVANGNKTKAAELLGVPRGTLRHQLTK